MSRLYEALSAIEPATPPPGLSASGAAARPPGRRRRGRARWALALGAGGLAVGAAGLALGPVLPVRGGSAAVPVLAPRPVPAPIVFALSPGSPRGTVEGSELRERARLAVRLGALEEAQNLLDQALGLDRTDALTWNDLGVVRFRLGQHRQGIEAFEQALALDPKHADTHRNLAVALEQDGDRRKAATHYRAFLTLAPAHPDRAHVERRLASSTVKAERP